MPYSQPCSAVAAAERGVLLLLCLWGQACASTTAAMACRQRHRSCCQAYESPDVAAAAGCRPHSGAVRGRGRAAGYAGCLARGGACPIAPAWGM